MKTVLVDHVWILDSSYNTRQLQSLNEAFFSCLQAVSDHVNCVMAAGFTGPTWSGELSDKYTAAVYIYCNIGRRNCSR